MTRRKSKKNCACCRVEALIGVDSRGQMVLPKSLREKMGIKTGDKLAVVTWGPKEKITCLVLVKTEDLNKMAKNLISPIVKEVNEK